MISIECCVSVCSNHKSRLAIALKVNKQTATIQCGFCWFLSCVSRCAEVGIVVVVCALTFSIRSLNRRIYRSTTNFLIHSSESRQNSFDRFSKVSTKVPGFLVDSCALITFVSVITKLIEKNNFKLKAENGSAKWLGIFRLK